MATEQIFDPNLGEERDAFPGEVVPLEQQKTLQRLMREEEERFTTDLAKVVVTGKLPPSDVDAVRRFAKLRAEIIRQQYLEALNSNPANILQATLKEFDTQPNSLIIRPALTDLNERVANLQNNVEVERASDKMRAVKQGTLSNIDNYLKKDSLGNVLTNINFGGIASGTGREKLQNITLELLQKLGLLPSESLNSFSDLYKAVQAAKNPPFGGDAPFASGSNEIFNLSSNRPGLEGIGANIYAYRSSIPFAILSLVQINGTPEALARIIDKGQYVPYSPAAR